MRGKVSFIALVFSLSASVAWAQDAADGSTSQAVEDTAPPEIVHEPVVQTTRESELAIKAVITDPSGVFAPMLSYRESGSGGRWSLVDMNLIEGEPSTYVGVISAAEVRGNVEYFIEAYDNKGNGPAQVGSAESPMRVLAVDNLVATMSDVDVVDTVDDGFDSGMSTPFANGFPIGPAALAGAGVVLTAVGAVLWFSAAGKVQEIDKKYDDPTTGRLPADTVETQDAIGRSRIGSGLMIAGGVAVAGGVAWFFVPGSDGAEVGVSGSF